MHLAPSCADSVADEFNWNTEKAILVALIASERLLRVFFMDVLTTTWREQENDEDPPEFEYIVNAINSFVFAFKTKGNMETSIDCFGVSIRDEPVRINILDDLRKPCALEMRRAIELHEILHALRYYIYQEGHRYKPHQEVPVSPEKYRPSAAVQAEYGNECELGLYFQEQMFSGLAHFQNDQCSIIFDHKHKIKRCATFTVKL
jgi:hypothetical protein